MDYILRLDTKVSQAIHGVGYKSNFLGIIFMNDKLSLAVVIKHLMLGMTLNALVSFPAMAEESSPQAPVTETKSLPLDELRLFTEVFQRIKSAYVEPVDDAELLENALRGMVAGLDPHSAYLEPEEFESLQENTSGEFGGLGIEVGMEDGFIRVITPIDDTPAQRAGVKAGDLITKLDETPVQGLDLNQAVELMRGKPGVKSCTDNRAGWRRETSGN